MEKIKKTLFNDGFLSVEFNKNGKKNQLYSDIPFGIETVTENRFNAGMASGDRIEKAVHIPHHGSLPHNSTVIIDGEKYAIWKQQAILKTNPPITVLLLKNFK